MNTPYTPGWYGEPLDSPPSPEQLTQEREVAKQFFEYVATLQAHQAIEIHPVRV